MTTTTNVKQTKLNIMTQAQYNSATKSATELYMVTDAQVSYNDLTDKPTIPTVNNATLTITQGGTTKGTFTANASSDVTIALDAGGGGTVAIDNLTITENTNNEIQTVGVIDSRSGSAIKTWTGTKNQYDAIVSKDANTVYNVDDGIVDIGDLVDGQWVQNYSVLAAGVTFNKTTNVDYSLSSYLPNDGANYNVLFEVLSISSSSGYVSIPVSTDLFYPNSYIRCANIHNLGWGNFEQTEHIWIPVGTARKITIVGVSWLGDTQYNLTALGYRRMGTNV